jgi:hypothetical protein
MRRKIVWGTTFFLSLFLYNIPCAHAQQASPNSTIQWDQPAPTLADAQAYTYKYYADGSTTGVVFNGVTCNGTASPFTCTVLFPAFTPGNHTIRLTAQNIAGESTPSSPFGFTFVVTPSSPNNIRIGSAIELESIRPKKK